MSFKPIKTKKIYEEIMEQLKDMISSGELKPGERLPSERDMSDSLGVSRASVREALTALEAIGILAIHPGEGTFVRETSVSRVFEPLAMVLAVERNPGAQMMEIRRILETEAAALAALRANEENLKNIEDILDKMKKADKIQDAVEFDLKFHYAIAEASHNTILLRMMNTVADLMHHTFRTNRENFYADELNGPRTLREHEAIAAAIRAQKPDLARDKMLEHINNIEAGIEHGLNYQE
ncbi:MAG: FadR/GntR family transcriptional regulator [Syntrophomonadaceae bacterium]|nr:FadR/GntR family transcriptional regulator [Syntrophomonadaceae bacterium]MDD3024126.1 FadR/GntR family transcriptional regulator [Syntrophomonadaceae bacterium]